MIEDIYASDDKTLPDIDDSAWPRIAIKRLSLWNYGKHEDIVIDFFSAGKPIGLSCLVGPNGTGKTTILSAIQNLCSSFSGYEASRYFNLMMRAMRNSGLMSPAEILQAQEDGSVRMRVTGLFAYTNAPGEYEVEFTQNKFVKAHPEFISLRLPYYCFSTKFDQELHLFQLKRDRWPLFQELFSSVTGYPVEEDDVYFSQAADRRVAKLLKDYVMGFKVKKEYETISQKQMSSGERKIAKCLSTILNKPVAPSIILIDNSVMHIEVGRHIAVIRALEKCFPRSQLIVTAHSEPIMKAIPDRQRLMDMRFLTDPRIIAEQPWRLRLLDEIDEAILKVEALAKPSLEARSHLEQSRSIRKLLSDGSLRLERRDMDAYLSHLSALPGLLADDFWASPVPLLGSSPR